MIVQWKPTAIDRSFVDSTIDEDKRGSRISNPSPEDQTTALKEEEAATEALRKRLKAGLRPDFSSDGLHQIEMMQCLEKEMTPATGPNRQNDSSEKAVKRMPSMGIRKVSSQWDHYNPFQVSVAVETGSKLEAMMSTDMYKVPRQTHDSSLDQGDDDGTDISSLTQVALANTSGPNAEHKRSPPPSYNYQSSPAVRSSINIPNHSAKMSLSGLDSAGPSPLDSHSCSSDGATNSPPLVVARAQCELAHPRPSRSSESRMLKVLVKGKEGDQDNDVEEQDEDEEEDSLPRRHSHTSQESVSSFHTAQQSDHSDG